MSNSPSSSKRRWLRERLYDLLQEYDYHTSGLGLVDPDIIVKVRRYFAELESRRGRLAIVKESIREDEDGSNSA